MADALAHTNLSASEHLTYFLANCTLMNIRNSGNCSSASIRLGLAPRPKPVWGELEIELCDFIRVQHKIRRQVTQMVVLHEALQLNPQFCDRILDPQFIKRATSFYYRFIHRRQNMPSIQKLTSVGQKRSMGSFSHQKTENAMGMNFLQEWSYHATQRRMCIKKN